MLSGTCNAVKPCQDGGGTHGKYTTENTTPQWELISAICSAEREATEQGKEELCESSPSRARALPGDKHQPAFLFHAPTSCHCTVWVGIPLAQGSQESHVLLCLGQADSKVTYPFWTGTTGTKAQAMTFTSNPCAGANAFSKHIDMHHWKWAMLLTSPTLNHSCC